MSSYAHALDWRLAIDSEAFNKKVTLDEMTGFFPEEDQHAIPDTNLENVERNTKVKQEVPSISHRRKYSR